MTIKIKKLNKVETGIYINNQEAGIITTHLNKEGLTTCYSVSFWNKEDVLEEGIAFFPTYECPKSELFLLRYRANKGELILIEDSNPLSASQNWAKTQLAEG